MAKKGEIYEKIRRDKVQALEDGGGTLVCLGQDMTFIQ